MNRRKFLQGTAALFCAPAIVKAGNIMPIYVPPQHIEPWGTVDVYVSEFFTAKIVPDAREFTEDTPGDGLADIIYNISPHEVPLRAHITHGEYFELHSWESDIIERA